MSQIMLIIDTASFKILLISKVEDLDKVLKPAYNCTKEIGIFS